LNYSVPTFSCELPRRTYLIHRFIKRLQGVDGGMQVLGTRRHRVGQVFVSVGGKTTNITATAFSSIFYLDQRERVEKRQVNGVQTQNKRQRGARASHSVSLLCVFFGATGRGENDCEENGCAFSSLNNGKSIVVSAVGSTGA
jgi:hypothetical protein